MAAFVIVEVPFHMGLEDAGVGRGPARLLQAGADRALETEDGPAQVLHIRKLDLSTSDIDAVVDVNRQLRQAVSQSIAEGLCPVVLAGNCNSALGTIAGMAESRTGIVWLDAHADFNTPESSLSGMLDGMVLAALTGHCHEELRERIGLYPLVPEENVLLLGLRDLDPEEKVRLGASEMLAFGMQELDNIGPALAALKARVDAVYLHVDMDFLDASESPGVNFRGPGGVSLDRAVQLLTRIVQELPVAAIALTNHNPESDPRGVTAAAGVRLLRAIAGACPSPAPH